MSDQREAGNTTTGEGTPPGAPIHREPLERWARSTSVAGCVSTTGAGPAGRGSAARTRPSLAAQDAHIASESRHVE
jgi:hypothetical protein